MEIQGSTALVTGSNRGIGRAIVDALAARGAAVLAGVRALDEAHEGELPAAVRAVRMDLSSPEAVEGSVRELGADAERVDILINNAGAFKGGLLERQEPHQALDLIQVNLAAPIHLTRLLLPAMTRRETAKIVNNTSIIGHVNFPGATVYAATKAGLAGFTRSLRRELEGTSVSVLELITPGVDTDMMEQVQRELDEHADTSGWDQVEPEDWARKVAGAIEDDEDTLGPGGTGGLAKLLPKPLTDLAAKRAFSR